MRPWLHRHRWSLPTGTLTVCAVAGLFQAGAWERVNDAGYDACVTRYSTVPVDDRIVLIDVDDVAIDRVGRWPWQRIELARLTQTLHDLGAQTIVLDMTFPDAQPPSVDAAGWAPHDDPTSRVLTLEGQVPSETPVDHDAIFGAAIEDAGNVYLGIHAAIDDHAHGGGGAASAHGISATLDQMAARLESDFTLQPAALAALLDLPESVCAAEFDAAKTLAARRLAERFVHQQPEGSWSAFRRFVYGDDVDAAGLGDRADLLTSFTRAKALRLIVPRLAPAPAEVRDMLPRVSDVRPPVAPLAAAAAGVGLVVYQPQQRGIVRSVPVMAVMDDRLLPSLGLAAAADLLGMKLGDAAWSDGECRLAAPDGARVVPIDENGETLIPWTADASGDRGLRFGEHVPVLRLLEISEARRAIAVDQRWEQDLRAETVRLFPAVSDAFARYESLREERQRFEAGEAGVAAGDGGEALRRLIDEMERLEADSAVRMAMIRQECEGVPGEEVDAVCHTIRSLSNFLSDDAKARRAEYRRNLERFIETRTRELRPRIEGKLSLVGLTATSIGDFITTPSGPMVPGAVAHANIINGLLTNRFWRLAPRGWDLAAIASLGLIVTFLACVTRPWIGGVATAAALVALPHAAGWWFARHDVFFAYPSVMIAAGAAWMTVTVAREVTEYRLRRRVVRVLGQYTSPTIAARVADDAGRVGFEPRRARVTCCFVDLRNFTAISEALGPERTRDLLNPYLSSISERLIQSGAMVNKFLGDGIFAFFDAPILPCPNAARRACEAAAACPELVRRLNGGGVEAAEALRVKVGLATGDVAVGDFGTGRKRDYTCIGDVVNVAARLEAANARLGTTILVDRATRDAAGDGFRWLPLGRLHLPGRAGWVEAYSMLTGGGDGAERSERFLASFAAGVDAFQRGEWGASVAAFQQCLAEQPDDPAARRYLDAASTCLGAAPVDFDGAIRVA